MFSYKSHFHPEVHYLETGIYGRTWWLTLTPSTQAAEASVNKTRAREMAQVALPEDWGPIPSIHKVANNPLYFQTLRTKPPSLASLGTRYTCGKQACR